ncbi:MAG: hypothetical protein V5A31_13920 [Haloferacaceae archaeon]|jgi:hypothetical protein
MDWKRERDGLVVVGAAVLVLVLVGTGRGAGLASTFVATFLGVLAALRFDELLGGRDEEPTTTDDAPTAPAAAVDPERTD